MEENAQELRSGGFVAAGQTGVESRWHQVARVAFTWLAVGFALCVVVQVFLAGLAIFVSPANWVRHATFVHFFEALPILMFLVSLAGRLDDSARWQSASLFGLVFAQYLTANIRVELPWVAALHPVLALVLFWASAAVAARAVRGTSAPPSPAALARARDRDTRAASGDPLARILRAVILGLVAGFVAGILVSEVVGVTAMLLLGHAVGVKFLPLYLAVAGAAVGLLMQRRG